MSRSGYDYEAVMHEALIGAVRKVMTDAAENGLPGQHHFYLTFATQHPGVVMPDYLKAQYPDEMPLILQHQFWGLEVADDRFEVTLSFRGVHERLRVPWDALTAFADPSVNFVLRLGVVEADEGAEAAAAEAPVEPDQPDGEDADNVVAIDTFRKS